MNDSLDQKTNILTRIAFLHNILDFASCNVFEFFRYSLVASSWEECIRRYFPRRFAKQILRFYYISRDHFSNELFSHNLSRIGVDSAVWEAVSNCAGSEEKTILLIDHCSCKNLPSFNFHNFHNYCKPTVICALIRKWNIKEESNLKKYYEHFLDCVRSNFFDGVKVLLDAGLDPNFWKKQKNSQSALNIIFNGDRPELAKLLYMKGVQFDYRSKSPHDYWNWCNKLPLFLANGGDPNMLHFTENNRFSDHCSLTIAVCSKNLALVERIVKAGINIDGFLGKGQKELGGSYQYYMTALQQSILNDDIEMAELLLKLRANPNFKGNEKTTPLSYCCWKKLTPFVALLKSYGATHKGGSIKTLYANI